MWKRSAKWAKTKTLKAKDVPIDALPAQLLFMELKVDEREAFLCSLCYGLLNCLVSVQRQWKNPSISLSISTSWNLKYPPNTPLVSTNSPVE
jgi:hypothetical protein